MTREYRKMMGTQIMSIVTTDTTAQTIPMRGT